MWLLILSAVQLDALDAMRMFALGVLLDIFMMELTVLAVLWAAIDVLMELVNAILGFTSQIISVRLVIHDVKLVLFKILVNPVRLLIPWSMDFAALLPV